MTVRELRKLLFDLKDQEAIIDMASDEEGNSYGDIDDSVVEVVYKNGTRVYSLYPINSQLPEDRYK